MMTGGDDGVAKLWDTVTGELVEEFNFHADKIRTLSDFCGSEHLWVTGGYDSVAYLFDVRDSSKPVAKVNHGAPIEFVELSAANNLLVTVGGNMLKLWDVSNGLILLYAFEPHQRTVVRGYVRDSILTASLDGTVRYFNYSSGYQSGHGSFDDKYVSAVSGGALVDAEEGSLAPSPVTRSTGGASELEREVESDGNYVDTVKGLASAEEERKSPTNTIAANEEMHSDSSDFVTPLSNGFSPGDHFTPMSDDGSVSDCGGDTPMVSEGSTKRKRVSPKMGGKMRGLGGLLSDPTEERPVSLRHVYRFNDPVVSFAVSLDAKSIAVGLSSGEWVIRHNTREASEEEPQAKKVIRIAENVVEYKTAKLSLLDRLVKTFQYQAAMDLSLSLTPNHVYNLVETLILRGSLATAVRGKDEQTILPLLRFVSSHLGNDIHNTNTLLELAHAVLDNNQWLETCDNTRVIQELRKIPNKINFELFQHNILQTLKGSLDLVLNRQVTVNESYD
ncbi:WD domain, G-beta repeat containing protein, putative [Babesia caballi]|uniref:WD domain, G-beta repeat containing protein, putative n=1 Tax=Babesia caballi TaxID=5871 RepID=A0AAV4M2A4_BABCB|nr:WD domain, G-beta repeat containing protein, putative [Babesia caballi]